MADCRADVVFLLDASAGSDSLHWSAQKQFVMDIIQSFKVRHASYVFHNAMFTLDTNERKHLSLFLYFIAKYIDCGAVWRTDRESINSLDDNPLKHVYKMITPH